MKPSLKKPGDFTVAKGHGHPLVKAIAVVSIYLSMWAVPGRFFQSLPVPCGASLDVTSPDVTNSREKRNQGQSDFLRQKIW
jgi:hypothetical protein